MKTNKPEERTSFVVSGLGVNFYIKCSLVAIFSVLFDLSIRDKEGNKKGQDLFCNQEMDHCPTPSETHSGLKIKDC